MASFLHNNDNNLCPHMLFYYQDTLYSRRCHKVHLKDFLRTRIFIDLIFLQIFLHVELDNFLKRYWDRNCSFLLYTFVGIQISKELKLAILFLITYLKVLQCEVSITHDNILHQKKQTFRRNNIRLYEN